MAIRIALHDHTECRFNRPVARSPHRIRRRPAPRVRTSLDHDALSVAPAIRVGNGRRDPSGSDITRDVFPEKTRWPGRVARCAVMGHTPGSLEPGCRRRPGNIPTG